MHVCVHRKRENRIFFPLLVKSIFFCGIEFIIIRCEWHLAQNISPNKKYFDVSMPTDKIVVSVYFWIRLIYLHINRRVQQQQKLCGVLKNTHTRSVTHSSIHTTHISSFIARSLKLLSDTISAVFSVVFRKIVKYFRWFIICGIQVQNTISIEVRFNWHSHSWNHWCKRN